LTVYVFNVGHRKTIITNVGFREEDEPDRLVFGRSPNRQKLDDLLPLVLDVDECSPQFVFDGMADRVGVVTSIVLVDHNEKERSFDARSPTLEEDESGGLITAENALRERRPRPR
jgi:hypothetical protein